jgi:D-alanyl-D-alanine carboxypeptidase/D-alanyl-D-alanine-endopeptidase (penicillin-binding protein 4)
MMRASDNYAAEMILREIDRNAGGPGSTAGGAARVVEDMAAAGVDVAGVHLNDGSGLDTGNRSTCRALAGTLALAAKPKLGAVVDGLAVAGRSGTLIKRFLGTPVEGRLAAKTGWINGVAGLAGRIDVPRSRNFALLLNGSFSYARSSAVQNRVVDVLATTP